MSKAAKQKKGSKRSRRTRTELTLVRNEPPLEHGLHDEGAGKRFVEQHGDDVRFVPKWGKWLVWNGQVWNEEEDDGRVQQMAVETARSIYREADARPTLKKSIDAFAKRRMDVVPRRMMLVSASSEQRVIAHPDDFNQKPFLLCVGNGTIDLKTQAIRPHAQGDMLTRMTSVEYDPEAKDRLWELLLKRMYPDREVREYVQRAMGYSVSGRTDEDVFFFLIGEGGSGKGTFLKAITNVLGKRYAGSANFNILLNKQENRFAFSRLDMCRIVTAQEAEKASRFDSNLIRALTGSDNFVAERKGKDDYEFVPQWTWWLSSNYRPSVDQDDTGMWRRLREIPINKPLPIAQRKPELRKHLWESEDAQRAILAWLVEGYRMYAKQGLTAPPAVALACDEYREGQDSFGKFLRARCEFDPRGQAHSEYEVAWRDLVAKYTEWCEEENETVVRLTLLPRRVTDMGFDSTNIGSSDDRVKGRRGIRLYEESFEDELDELWRESMRQHEQDEIMAYAEIQYEIARIENPLEGA